MKTMLTIVLLLALPVVAIGETQVTPLHPISTYSIICFDSATGQFGAAVQSHWFKVADVIWVEAGVGAVATQSLAEFSYGPLGLQMMRMGKSPQQALDGLTESDPSNAVRQVAMIDARGEVAVFTGEKCIAEAGHRTGSCYSVQANLMERSTVWDAMAEAYETTTGDLADKMMAALEAAQAEGGDIRGKQSAAMVVVSGTPTGMSWRDMIIDIRVDDSPEPLKELRRLLNVSRAYSHMNMGDEFVASGDFGKAGKEYSMAARLAPGNPEILFWHAATLVEAGQIELALPIFKEVFGMDENWRVLVPRLVKSDLLPDDTSIVRRIIAQ